MKARGGQRPPALNVPRFAGGRARFALATREADAFPRDGRAFDAVRPFAADFFDAELRLALALLPLLDLLALALRPFALLDALALLDPRRP